MDGIKKRISRLINWIKPCLGHITAVLIVIIRMALGLIFIYSGVEKIGHPQDFLATVYDFRLTGPMLGLMVAIMIPWLELFLGCALIIGIYTGGMLLVASALGALFLIVQASVVVRGLTVSCGCFGPDESHIVGKGTLFRTMLIFLTAVVTWYLHYRRVSPRCQSMASETLATPIKLRIFS